MGYDARISENLEKDLSRFHPEKSIRDYTVSELLIEDSHIHILVFPFPKKTDPHHLSQSVTMEYTMIRERKKPYVIVLVEEGLQENIRNSFGGVMKGSLKVENPGFEYEIIEYNKIKDTYSELTMILYRFIREIWETHFHPTFRSLLCEIIFFMMRPKQSNNFPNRFIQIENFGDDSAFNPK